MSISPALIEPDRPQPHAEPGLKQRDVREIQGSRTTQRPLQHLNRNAGRLRDLRQSALAEHLAQVPPHLERDLIGNRLGQAIV